jgi:nucleoside-diphosphate-sugar epimerase
MKHLITGVAGFVGSNLARKLLNAGHQVTGIDNMACGYFSNIKDLINHKSGFHYEKSDIIDYKGDGGSFDSVWHFGARGELYYCRDNIGEAIDVNVKGTLNMLKVAKESLAKHFYFADTSAEYDSFDDEQYYPTAEWMSPNTITPMGYYAITKMAASQFVRSFGLSNDMGTTLFRYTNIYGPEMNLSRSIPPVIGSFTKRLFNDEVCTIYGDGSKRRDFLHIDDLSDLHMAALERRQDKKDSQTFNGGSGENHSIHEVWDVVYHACLEYYPKCSGRILYKEDQPNEAQITLANIDKAKEHLDWEPKISFDEGVGKTITNLWERHCAGKNK